MASPFSATKTTHRYSADSSGSRWAALRPSSFQSPLNKSHGSRKTATQSTVASTRKAHGNDMIAQERPWRLGDYATLEGHRRVTTTENTALSHLGFLRSMDRDASEGTTRLPTSQLVASPREELLEVNRRVRSIWSSFTLSSSPDRGSGNKEFGKKCATEVSFAVQELDEILFPHSDQEILELEGDLHLDILVTIFRILDGLIASGETQGLDATVFVVAAKVFRSHNGCEHHTKDSATTKPPIRIRNADAAFCLATVVRFLNQSILHDEALQADDQTPSKAMTLIFCLASMIQVLGKHLCAEETATTVVSSALLPILTPVDTSETRPAPNEDLIIAALACLSQVLAWKHLSAAIIAPLTLDVSSAGTEVEVRNPMRLRVLQCLTNLVVSHNSVCLGDNRHRASDALFLAACDSLSAALKAVQASEIKSTVVPAANGCSVDPTFAQLPAIVSQIRKSLSWEDDPKVTTNSGRRQPRTRTLALLASLTRVYRGAAAANGFRLLEDTPSSLDPQSQPSGMLGILADSKASTEEKLAVLEAIRELLTATPLPMWSSFTSRRDMHRTRKAPVCLSDRVVGVWCTVTVFLTSMIEKHQWRSREIQVGLFELVGALGSVVPFQDGDELTLSAIELLRVSGKLFLEESKNGISGDTTGMPECFCRCFGGKTSADGRPARLPLPSSRWLSSEDGSQFLYGMWAMLETRAKQQDSALHILAALGRTAPWYLLKDASKFRVLANPSCTATEQRTLHVNLLLSVCQGRRDFGCDAMMQRDHHEFLHQFVAPLLLHHFLVDPMREVRRQALACFGTLYLDMEDFVNSNALPMYARISMLRVVLRSCLSPHGHSSAIEEGGGEKDANLRREACRAIGNVCSTRDFQQVTTFTWTGLECKPPLDAVVGEVFVTVKSALSDSNASVRSMALFAVGNAALFLISTKLRLPGTDPTLFIDVSTKVLSCLDENNEKVLANAIRSIGFLHCIVCDILNVEDWPMPADRSKFCRRCMNALGNRIQLVLQSQDDDDVIDGQRGNSKFRTTLQKHAQGACLSLRRILTCGVVTSEESTALAGKAQRRLLFSCIRRAGGSMEKVSAAAVETLLELFSNEFQLDDDGCSDITSCLIPLFEASAGERRKLSPPLSEKISLLLEKLLQRASDLQIINCCMSDDMTPSVVTFLFDWITHRDSIDSLPVLKNLEAGLRTNNSNSGDHSIQRRLLTRSRQRFASQENEDEDEL